MSENLNQANLWEDHQEVTEVTVNQLDNLAKEIAHARGQYEELKEAATAAHGVYEELTQKMIGLLKACGRDSHKTPGVGLMRFAAKESYRVPKDNVAKRALFKYIQEKYGVEGLTEMLSIHAAKLNSWANTEVEADPNLQIPGLEAPTMTETFYFTKK